MHAIIYIGFIALTCSIIQIKSETTRYPLLGRPKTWPTSSVDQPDADEDIDSFRRKRETSARKRREVNEDGKGDWGIEEGELHHSNDTHQVFIRSTTTTPEPTEESTSEGELVRDVEVASTTPEAIVPWEPEESLLDDVVKYFPPKSMCSKKDLSFTLKAMASVGIRGRFNLRYSPSKGAFGIVFDTRNMSAQVYGNDIQGAPTFKVASPKIGRYIMI